MTEMTQWADSVNIWIGSIFMPQTWRISKNRSQIWRFSKKMLKIKKTKLKGWGTDQHLPQGWMVKQMDWKMNPTSPKGWRADPKPPPVITQQPHTRNLT